MRKPPKKLVVLVGILVVAITITILVVKVFFPEPTLDAGNKMIYSIETNADNIYVNNQIDLIVANIEEDYDDLTATQKMTSIAMKQARFTTNIINENLNELKVGLLYTNRTQNYNDKIKQCQKLYEILVQKYDSLEKYIKNIYLPYAQTPHSFEDLNKYYQVIKNDYVSIVNVYNNINKSLCEVFVESSVNSMQVNNLCRIDAKLSSAIINKLIENIDTVEILSTTLTNIENVIDNDFQTMPFSNIVALTELSEKVDLNLLGESIVLNSLPTFVNSQTNINEYKTFCSDFLNIEVA